MPVLYNCPEFPKIEYPLLLSEFDRQQVIMTYLYWIKNEMMLRGNSEQYIEDFFSLNQHVDVLRKLPIRERLMHITNETCIGYCQFQSSASTLQNVFGLDFLPLQEVISDANFAYAETGDLVLRVMRHTSMSKQQKKTMRSTLDCMIGISTFDEIKIRYLIANNALILWLSDMYKILGEVSREDMRRSQTVILETISAKHIQALSRLLLVDMADWLETQTDVRLDITTGFEVLPHLLLHPDMRNILQEKSEEIGMALCVISQTSGSTFNDTQTVTEVYTNFGCFAMILGAYDWARKAFKLASKYASIGHMSLINKNLGLINLICPSETN